MNNKGQLALFGLMVGVIIFFLGMGLINPIKDVVNDVRTNSETNLSCDVSTISDGQKLTCLAVDLILPYFIVTILAVAGGYITARWI